MQKEDYSEIFNWENVLSHSDKFKNQKPFRYVFIENLFKKKFYEKLYESFPPIDDSWLEVTTFGRYHHGRTWGIGNDDSAPLPGDDPRYPEEWNKLKRYCESKECIDNVRKLTGLDVNKLRFFNLINMIKGGFQLPHEHALGDDLAICMMYFNKNWEEGDPGGTYVSSELDEKSILFEPYNLDNSMVIFQDGPTSFHGARRIVKNVERRALQIYWGKYEDGDWVGNYKTHDLVDE